MELSQPQISSSTQTEILNSSSSTYGATKYGSVIAENGVKRGRDKGKNLTDFVNFNGSIGAPLNEVFSKNSIYISNNRHEELSRELYFSTEGLPPTTITFIRYYLDSLAILAGCCTLKVNGEPISSRAFLGSSCPIGWTEKRTLSCDDYASIYPILECLKIWQRGLDEPPNACGS